MSHDPQSLPMTDTPRQWPPARVIADLRDLAATIAVGADHAIALLATIEDRPGEVEISYPVDDHEALTLGFPCLGAWRAMAGQFLAGIDRPVRLVPRGSTAATAEAIEAHSPSLTPDIAPARLRAVGYRRPAPAVRS